MCIIQDWNFLLGLEVLSPIQSFQAMQSARHIRNGAIVPGSQTRCCKAEACGWTTPFLLNGLEKSLDRFSEVQLLGGIEIPVLALENFTSLGDRNGFDARPAQIYPDGVIHSSILPFAHTP